MKTDDHESLLELLDSWFALSESGHSVTPEQHCKKHPDLLSAFLRVLSRDSVAEGIFREAREADDAPASDAPATIGEYEIVSTLGVGGSGTVYLARQPSLDRMVALKVLRAIPGSDHKAELRLRREAELIASLEHAHIVPIYAVGEDDGRVWVAMKHLEGPALDHRSEPLEIKEVARIGSAAALALHEAHQAGIIHRDVKPSNIMLDHSDPYVLDFGLARTTDEVSIVTQEGRVAGTLPYMSPEQLRSQGSKVAIDSRTDIYSLGATLYEWAAGQRPFRSTETGDLIRQILIDDPAPPSSKDRDLSTIILKCLEKDRDQRYSTAEEVSEDLQRWLKGLPILARRLSLPGRAWKLVRRHPRASILAAGAVLATGILGGLLFLEHDRTTTRFEATLSSIDSEIERGSYPLAQSLLEQASSEQPHHSELNQLQQRFEAATTLEDLLDLLQSKQSSQDLPRLKNTVARIEALGGILSPPSKVYAWELARALSLIMQGDVLGAEQAISALPQTRAKQALSLASLSKAANKLGKWDLPPVGDHPLLDHLFSALAMRHAGRAGEERLSEIRQGRAIDETNWRLILLELIYRSYNGEDPRVNYFGLQGLARNGAYRPVVRRLMLWQATLMGDEELLKRMMAKHLEETPAETSQSSDFVLRAQAQLRLRNPEEALKIAQAGLARWPNTYDLLMNRATAMALLRQPEEAEASLASAAQAASTPKERADAVITRAQLSLLRAQAVELPLLIDLNESQRGQVDQVIDQLNEQLQLIMNEMPEHPPIAESARALAARALFARGRFEESEQVLDLPGTRELKANASRRSKSLFEAAHQGWIRCVLSMYLRSSPKPEWKQFEQDLNRVHQGLTQHAKRAEACLEAWSTADYSTSPSALSSERQALAAVMKATFLTVRRKRREALVLIEDTLELTGITSFQRQLLGALQKKLRPK